MPEAAKSPRRSLLADNLPPRQKDSDSEPDNDNWEDGKALLVVPDKYIATQKKADDKFNYK